MPSLHHEALLQLFRNRPLLAPELLREALPPFSEARLESAELTDIQPAEYRADLVVFAPPPRLSSKRWQSDCWRRPRSMASSDKSLPLMPQSSSRKIMGQTEPTLLLASIRDWTCSPGNQQ